jgi:hypothetical protein
LRPDMNVRSIGLTETERDSHREKEYSGENVARSGSLGKHGQPK